MGTMMLLVGGGLVVALLVFFFFEERSLKDAQFSDFKCMMTEDMKVSDCMEKFSTIKFLSIYAVLLFLANLAVAKMVFLPNAFGLTEGLIYTFVPSLLGSLVILLVKWSYQPLIKLVSSFLYGSIYIGATASSLLVTFYLLA